MNLAERMKNLWENTYSRNAHLGIDKEKDMLFGRYEEFITKRMSVTNKTIIDFGCGGGLLGLFLLSNFKIKKYIAYDIAERSLNTAKEYLKEFKNTEFNLLEKHIWDFKGKNPDIIVALAVIIHFPTQVYLDNFLKDCNESGAKKLVLEIRDMGEGTRFQKDVYGTMEKVRYACFTEEGYITSKLSNYKLKFKTDPVDSSCSCQILIYEKKKKEK